MLSVERPAGAFVYPAGEDRPLVLIAGGVGITPLMSMLRHAIDAEPTRPVTLFYSVRTVEDIAFRDEIRLLDRRHDHFRAFIAISDGPAGPGFFPGRIDEALLSGHGARHRTRDQSACADRQPMLDAMSALLTSMGVPTSSRSASRSSRRPSRRAAGRLAAGRGRARPTTDPTRCSSTRSGVTARIDARQTVLEAAESCGAAIPSLCRAGVCGTCRTRV